MSMDHEQDGEDLPIEDYAMEGLHLAQAGDFGERFQRILDGSGAGMAGQIPSPEGLVLKALYHQSREGRGAANSREESALKEIVDTYKGVYGELSPQATPLVIYGLALALQRGKRPVEQELIADALEAAANKIRATGYIHGR